MHRASTASSLRQCHCDRRRQFTRAQLNSALIRPTTSTDAVIVTSEKTTSNFKGSYRGRSRGCSDKEAFKLLGKIDGVDVLAIEARYHESYSCRRTTSDVMVASIIKLVAVTLALVQWQNKKQYSNEFDIVWEYDQKELLQSGTVVCVTTCISSAWRSCIWLSTIQTTTLTSRWRSYLNHFGDQVQFWHLHWIHLVHVCSDNLFSLFQLIPLSHTCVNVYGCCYTVWSVFLSLKL